MFKSRKKDFGIINYQDLKSIKGKILYYSMLALCILIAFICIVPILWVMLSSLKDIKEFVSIPPTIIPRSFHPEKIANIWHDLNFGKYYLNSLISVSGSILCSVIFNGFAGFVISVLKPKGSRVIFYLILGSLMVPATTNLVPIFKNIVGVHLTNSFIPLWLSFGANAFNVLLYKSFFDGIPRSLIEAARLDGCNDFQIFYKLILPLSKAVNMVVIIFSLNAAWSDFLLPMLVLKDTDKYTVMLKIYYMSTGNNAFSVDYRLLALGFSIIPPAILFIFFQKYITKGLALSGIKG